MQRAFRSRLTSPNRVGGFTFSEVLLVAVISALLTAGLFYTLNTGEFSQAFSSARVDLQAEVRRAIDWISKDVRQTVSWDIADINNSPCSMHIKFRKVEGWDTVNDTLLLSSNYTEYSYDASFNSITRRLSDPSNSTIQTWKFNNIIQPPFYTIDSSSNIVPLNSSDLLTSRRIITVIAGQRQVRGSLNVSSILTAELKIRNE